MYELGLEHNIPEARPSGLCGSIFRVLRVLVPPQIWTTALFFASLRLLDFFRIYLGSSHHSVMNIIIVLCSLCCPLVGRRQGMLLHRHFYRPLGQLA